MVNHGKGGGKNPPAPPAAATPPLQEVPKDFAQVPPQDLYSTSDIRFVMMEVGKLTANVARLIDDVGKHGDSLNKISHQASFIKGWIAGAVVIVGFFIWIASSFLDHKWDSAIQALGNTIKIQNVTIPPADKSGNQVR